MSLLTVVPTHTDPNASGAPAVETPTTSSPSTTASSARADPTPMKVTTVTIAVIAMSMDGVTFRVARRVKPVGRLKVASELRRRLAFALSEAAIETRRWDLSDTPDEPVEKGRFLRRR